MFKRWLSNLICDDQSTNHTWGSCFLTGVLWRIGFVVDLPDWSSSPVWFGVQHITTLINARQAHQKKFSLEGKYFTGDCSHTWKGCRVALNAALQHCAWTDHNLYAVICRSKGDPFFNVKEKNHLNDKYEITNS